MNTSEQGIRSSLDAFRSYVTQFVNCHDFRALPAIMAEDYVLRTGDMAITGRDGDYRDAVARQMAQFPGLVFTPHEIFHVGDRLAVRFTEHGASQRHGGRRAAWSNIAIYSAAQGKLARCCIEQDFFGRREQLETGRPVPVDRPHPAPWDVPPSQDDPRAAERVRGWLESGSYLLDRNVRFDSAPGEPTKIVAGGNVEILDMVAGDGQVAFHAVHRGVLAGDFAAGPHADAEASSKGPPAFIHMTGLVCLEGEKIAGGNIIRDRWGLYRRLSAAAPRQKAEQ